MRCVLQLVLLGLISSVQASDQSVVYVSTLPEEIAKAVYDGKDSEMPIGPAFDIALSRRPDSSGKNIAPENISVAFAEMSAMLPHWYQNAMLGSSGEYECSVVVNGISYTTDVANWLWITWGMAEPSSKLRLQFADLGIRSREMILQALDSGFCEYLRHGTDAGISEIHKYKE